MRTVLSILLVSLVHWVAAAQEEPGAEYFRSSSISITITASVQGKSGQFAPYSVTQLTYDGKKGHIYEKILRPDLVPGWVLGTNLFFDHGKVTEENSREKTWTSYHCSGQEFVDYIYYLYGSAGIFTDTAQEGLARDPGYNTSETPTSIVIRPKAGSNAAEVVKSVIVRKAKPQLLLETTAVAVSKKQIVRESYSYDAGDLVDWSKVHPPKDVPEVKDSLRARMESP